METLKLLVGDWVNKLILFIKMKYSIDIFAVGAPRPPRYM